MTIINKLENERITLKALKSEKEQLVDYMNSRIGTPVLYTTEETKKTFLISSFEERQDAICIVLSNKQEKKIFYISEKMLTVLSFENEKELVKKAKRLFELSQLIQNSENTIAKLEKDIEDSGILQIMDYLRERGVTTLIHFTQIMNLKSILGKGLMPLNILKDLNMTYYVSDQNRIDDENHMNISISNPNSVMLYKKMKEGMPLVVLKIDVNALLDEQVYRNIAFSEHNATCSNRGKGVEKLKTLFRDELEYDGKIIPRCEYIPSNNTTDYQAEVLIYATIPPEYITSVEVKEGNEECYNYAKSVFDNVNYNTELFKQRIDQFNWIKEKTDENNTDISE